ENIIKEYIAEQADDISNVSIVLRNVCQTPYACSVVKKFIDFCIASYENSHKTKFSAIRKNRETNIS
ncbi:MAG: hypothetical protein LBF71_05815, partial [Campylobacteraceae bacterium]|nr:hypothetical protein [Campylobacteraceae bacterium]